MGGAFVKTFNPDVLYTSKIHPLPLTAPEKRKQESMSLSIITYFILFGIAFCPASYIGFVVKEKEVKSKYQQLVSGVSIPAYWLSTWIWDFGCYQITMWLMIIIICADHTKTKLLSGRDALGPLIGLFILFGMSSTSFSYVMSFLYKQAASGQVMGIFSFFLFGLVASLIGLFLRLLTDTSHLYLKSIRYLLLLLPPFAFGDGLLNLVFIETWSGSELKGEEMYKPCDWQITGANCVFMAAECVVYLVLAIVMDYSATMPSVQGLFVGHHAPPDATLRDEDVLEEERRVRYAAVDSANIIVKDVKKVYPGGKYAVKGISLSIPNGECFGLLGINGAGKSTTLSMLTGEIPPTEGNIYLSGLDLLKEVHKCRRHIGYCPQFDALFDLLTAREHLTLYARIKGVYSILNLIRKIVYNVILYNMTK